MTNILKICFRTIFLIAFTTIVLPFFLLFTIVFGVHRRCVDFILRKKIADKYGGLLSSCDQYFAVQQEVGTSVINVLFMVESAESNFSSIVKQTFKSRFFDAPERLAKFTGVCKQALGYYYVVKDEYSVDECVREVHEVVKDEQHLQEIFNKYGSLPLPKNGTTFWEVLVFKKPMKWNNLKNCFPIMFRFNHSLSDGINLTNALLKLLNDDPLIHQSKPIVSKLTKIEKACLWLKGFLVDAYIMIRMPSFILMGVLHPLVDSNALTAKAMSKKVNSTWKIEDGEIISKIKKIKNAIPETTFTDVLITAISATYEEYFVKNGLDVPENITLGYPINMNCPDAHEQSPVLFNKFSMLATSVPVSWNASLIDKLKEVKNREAIAKKNYSIHTNYFLFCVLANYFPPAVMKPVTKMSLTVLMSNILCPPYCTVFGGQLVEAIACGCLAPSCTTLVFFNYGRERFQIGLAADRALTDSTKGINEILDGISKYVNVMYQELNSD